MPLLVATKNILQRWSLIHIFKGSDVISCFQLPKNYVNVSILINHFLVNRSNDFEKVSSCGNGVSNASYHVVQIVRPAPSLVASKIGPCIVAPAYCQWWTDAIHLLSGGCL